MQIPPLTRALLLDLDGTLADSLSVMYMAYQRFLEQFQCPSSETEFAAMNGPPLSEVVRILKATHNLEQDCDHLLINYFEIIDELYANVKPSLGAIELLETAKANQSIVGIVTSNTKQRTKTWLKTVKLLHMIDFIISGDQVNLGKPNPEPYIIASKLAACKLDEIVAIEDSPQGAKSAVDAGLRTLVLSHQTSTSWPQKVEPISSLSEAAKNIWPLHK